jgi:hypothetical protein
VLATRACGDCGLARYCSTACQRAHRALHRAQCARWCRQLGKPTAASSLAGRRVVGVEVGTAAAAQALALAVVLAAAAAAAVSSSCSQQQQQQQQQACVSSHSPYACGGTAGHASPWEGVPPQLPLWAVFRWATRSG